VDAVGHDGDVNVASERTGLGPLETAVVLTLADAAAIPSQPYVKSSEVVRMIAECVGFGPNYAYNVICDLGRPWLTPLPLVDFHGDSGAPDRVAAPPSFTECRLSPAGWIAAAAQRGEIGPVPIGLINGTVYQGGESPPFRLGKIVAAVLRALDDPSAPDAELGRIAGKPRFPGGCELGGEIDAVLAGEAGLLVLRCRLRAHHEAGRHWIDVTRLPPQVGASALVDYLNARGNGLRLLALDWPWPRSDESRLPFRGVEDLTDGKPWGETVLVRCNLEPDADMTECLRLLRAQPGIRIDVRAHLPKSLGGLIRSWADSHRSEDVASGLQRLTKRR